jgi:transcriptional regulator with XRE-family HTH domain
MEYTDVMAGPHPVDRHVGLRIRVRRRQVGVSQEKLAEALNLTFQQVQKYEKGTNRVSASKLYEIAASLTVPVTYFFEGLDSPGGDSAEKGESKLASQHRFLLMPEALELIDLFQRARKPIRRKLVDLLGALVAECSQGDNPAGL